MTLPDSFHFLDPEWTDPRRMKRERALARDLRRTHWWTNKVQKGICHYCEKTFKPNDLTMDHLVPLARGGRSTKGNLVPACRDCNQKKRLETPVEMLLDSH